MMYRVVYEIEVEADSPLAAAEEVYKFMKDGAKPFFKITDKKGKIVEVDLEEEL